MQTVSELTSQIKSLLEATFMNVQLTGEVSRPTYHSSGHLYFTLKDDKSSISCVMFRGNNQKLKFRIEDGMMLNIYGGVSVYAQRGNYQVLCNSAEPSGVGALAYAFEQLKKELSEKGYFENKQTLPTFPMHIALVTSRTGAALQDMLKVAKSRWPLVKLTLIDTLVQGEGAAPMIAKALQKADTLKADIIVLSRGGGSVEDLWAFNEKEVAQALYECKTPTVSAIGHAIDTLISDFVADKNAPTPSAAMEMILPDINEARMLIDNFKDDFSMVIKNRLEISAFELRSFKERLNSSKPTMKIALLQEQIYSYRQKISQIYTHKIELLSQKFANQKRDFAYLAKKNLDSHEATLKELVFSFEAKNPKNSFKRGYAQVVQNGKSVEIETLKKDDVYELQAPKSTVVSKVLEIK